ncbi:MAG: hypothetical protein KAS67_03150 [Thermoplasmata archaeon]|nr:hypothetical protein [Thermoplasmata archaeon]
MKAEGTNLFNPNDETIITSIMPVENELYLAGSKKEKNYDVILIKIDTTFNIKFEKQFGNKISDYEGHNMIIQNDSLLICGCSEGQATEDGGNDLKAYLLKTNHAGIKEWEHSFRILGNECAVSIISNDNILLFGDSSNDAGKSQFFLICINQDGNVLWRKLYGEGTGAICGGIVSINDGFIISGSIKNDDIWHINIFKLNMTGEIEWEKKFEGYYVLDMNKLNDGFLLTGTKSGHIFLNKIDFAGEILWESLLDKGTGVSITTINDYIFLGGDLDVEEKSQPVLYQHNNKGKLVDKIIFEKEGWIETMAEFQGSLIAIRHGNYPKEHSELIQIKI